MAAFQVVVCALALFAFFEISSAGCYGYPGYGYGYGYGYDDCCCCCEPVTEITTVSCVPVVETFIEPCGCGYDGFYGGYYGYPGHYGYGGCYDGLYGGYGYGYPGYGYGCGCEPIVVDVDTYCAPKCGYGYY